MNHRSSRFALALAVLICLATAATVSAQLPPTLGAAQSFAVLAGTAVTNTGPTAVVGDLGVSPGTSITGFPPGTVTGSTHPNDGAAIAAKAAATTVYNSLSAEECRANLTGQNLGGLTLPPGVYCFDTSAQLTGTLTLDPQGNANAVFIFKIGSTLTTASGSAVVVSGGGALCNVYWQVGSSATLGTNSAMSGNVLAAASITATTGAAISGRTWALGGAVTLDTSPVTATCAAQPVCPTITVAPTTLPSGTVGLAYSQTLTSSGGAAPYSYTVASGVLPAGLTLTPQGVLAGTPTTAGSTTVTIRATDANGCSGTREYPLTIAAAPPVGCPTLVLAPATLPNGTVAVGYSQTLTASGGTAPYTYDIASGTLPAGTTLTPAGVLAGTPTTAGQTTVTIRGTDANGCVVVATYTITIAAAPIPPVVCPTITLTPPTLPAGRVAVGYAETLAASGGTAPYTFGVTAGTLPAGLTLTASGALSGTPTSAGETTVTIRGTDANGCFAAVTYTITIAAAVVPPAVCPPIAVTPSTLPAGTVGTAYARTLTGSGGAAPYSFGTVAGALPAGLTLSGGGALAGTPTTAGDAQATIRVTDANGCFAEVPYTIAIVAAAPPPGCPPISLSPSALPNGTVAVGYSQTIVGSGGTGPYTFRLLAGELPPGLTLTTTGVLSGTPTVAGDFQVTIRGTDVNGCFSEPPYTMSVVTAVPTLPQTFVVLLTLLLIGAGALRLRRTNGE